MAAWIGLNDERLDDRFAACRGRRTPALAFNTAASFITGTNWQAYAGEAAASHLAQMIGLVVSQFFAAAVGIAVAFVKSLSHLGNEMRPSRVPSNPTGADW